jgi:benzoate/toluate 1,2-dioxygenase beta subunit
MLDSDRGTLVQDTQLSPLSVDYHAAKAFVERELQLLDDSAFAKWLELFSAQGIYWVPIHRGQKSPLEHVSIFYDDRERMRTRVERLLHPMIHTQTPPSRTCRMLSAIRVEAPEEGTHILTAKYFMSEYRPGHPQRHYAGDIEYRLSGPINQLAIDLKKLTLINADGVFPALAVPF